MGVLSIQSSAVQGIQRGLDGMRRNAADIASAEQLNQAGAETDLASDLVNLEQNKVQVQANAKVVSAMDEVLGTIIDIRT
jgi:flagellar hook protein FlgE